MPRDPFDRLAALLSSTKGVADWKLRHRSDRETQLYLVGQRREALRTVDGDRYDATVYVDHEGKRGSSGTTLLRDYPDEWAERIAAAVFRAGLQSNPPFALPEKSRYPAVPLVDTTIRDRPEERAQDVAARVESIPDNRNLLAVGREIGSLPPLELQIDFKARLPRG